MIQWSHYPCRINEKAAVVFEIDTVFSKSAEDFIKADKN